MKRVVAFFDMFDEIPDKSKYLYSKKIEVPLIESEEQRMVRLSSNIPELVGGFFIHYYEVDNMDFEELIETGLVNKGSVDKMEEFMKRYKVVKK